MSSTDDRLFAGMRKSGKMSRIISPHMFEVSDSVYGENDIRKLWYEPGYDTDKWPDSSHVHKLHTSGTDVVDAFYKPLFERMRDRYWSYACKNHGYKTYEELKDIPCCNITKLCKDGRVLAETRFCPEDDDRQYAEQYGAEIFMPCLPEYCIKIEKWNVVYVKLLDRTESMCRIRFENYILQQRTAVCICRCTVEYRYEPDTESMRWISTDCMTYENFLTAFVPDMGWSEQEKRFWYDIFGVSPSDSPTLIEIPIPVSGTNDTVLSNTKMRLMQEICVYDKTDAAWLIQQFKKHTDRDIRIIDSGQSVLWNQKQKHMDNVFDKCITAIAMVNLQFIKNSVTAITPEQAGSNIKIGKMTVRTKTPLRTSLSEERSAEKCTICG